MQRPMMIQQERQHFNNNRGAITNTVAGLYDLEETLGSGHFAVVKLARHVFTGEKVAVKVIDKTKLDDISKAHLFQEVRCMKLVQHPHVVRLYEVIDTQTKLYLILELGDGGDLYDYIMRHESGLSENLAREYFRQIVRAISYCHQLHVVHRDLKPENVVFFEKLGVVKLTDFGFSNKFCPGQKLETSCGSLAYSAPEILLGDSYDAPAVDVWSLGVILYMLVCGQPPFQEANDSETLTMIMDCKYTMPSHVSDGCRKLISAMLVREPEKRATLQQIANDAWLQQGNNQQPEYLPLVSKEQVSDEDHAFIVQKMVNGNIAQKDEILEALDRNEYNHITATYFLLAERKLRAHQQDQQIKKKPDLSLPLSSPGTKNQCHIDDDKQDSNLLVVPIASMPRTPGGETCQGRNRKCSIVQEEEDDIGEAEPTSPLNRRGSRSEGRINLTVQDRLAAEVSERLKKQQEQQQQQQHQQHTQHNPPDSTKVATRGLIDGIAGVKLIKNDNNKEKFLGQAGAGSRTSKDIRSGSIDKMRLLQQKQSSRHGQSDVKILTDSSTIPAINITPIIANQIASKPFKTLPSPTRSNNNSSGACGGVGTGAVITASNCLKEIFEEGDAGSSDNSNTNTPRPILRSTGISSHHRRTKFHKSRTTSCSSSDASDDDNAEKKRNAAASVASSTKMIDSAIAKQFYQRRDSDSSDSQDPGSTTTTSNNNSLIFRNGSSNSSSNTNKSSQQGGNGNGGGGGSGGKTASLTSSQSEIGYRRHRAGRRRQTETRLRESQSLNRITEVQECEHNNINNNNNNNINIINNALDEDKNNNGEEEEEEEEIDGDNTMSTKISTVPVITSTNYDNNDDEDDDDDDVKISTMNQLNLVTTKATKAATKGNDGTICNVTNDLKANKNQNNNKAKGFSARFLQNLNFKRNHHESNGKGQQNKSNRNSMPPDSVPLLKLSTGKMSSGNVMRPPNNGQMPTDGSDRSKKIKILGRYFQVHKKICQPLSGLFRSSGNANLYKAQSCSSIIRDGIHHHHHHHAINNIALSTSSSSVSKHSTTLTPPSKFDEKMLNEREYLIKNCLGSFVGSDGDLNEKSSLDKQQQLLEYIDDDLLSGSKC